MPAMKGLVVSLDLAVSLPIVSTTLLLLFTSYNSQFNTLSEIYSTQAAQLKLYSYSQIIENVIYRTNPTYSQSLSLVSNLSSYFKLSSSIYPPSNFSGGNCSGITVCRVITLSGKSFVMVIRYANPN